MFANCLTSAATCVYLFDKRRKSTVLKFSLLLIGFGDAEGESK